MSKKLAVIVGVNDYSGTNLQNLRYCAADAEAFYEALIHYANYETQYVRLFSDGLNLVSSPPTYSDVLSAVQEMCTNATEDDSILFLFAGHGTRDEKDSYLLTKEYRSNVISDSSISMSKINEYFKQSPAKFKLRFFDACHSGRMGVRGLANPNVETDLAVMADGWATLAACREDQFAHELPDIGHGVFSYFLVKGLSGEASISNGLVTLDNLRVYVMDQTISLTKKLGLEQTPVFSGEQAGSLTMSIGKVAEVPKLPETLTAIQSVQLDQIEPVADDASKLLEQLRVISQRRTEVERFVTQDQNLKMTITRDLTDQLYEWAKRRCETNAALTPELSFTTQIASIRKMPLNPTLARFIYKSKIKDAVEWMMTTQTETRRERRPYNRMQMAGMMNNDEYMTVTYEVAGDIYEGSDHPKSSIELSCVPNNHLMPKSSMIVALMPSTFGVYLLVYFASTSLKKQMEESWSPESFSVQLLQALTVTEIPNLESILNEMHARFLSYTVESAVARQTNLVQIGAAPDTSLI